ncbi:MAG: hypothetical protein C0605_13505 [Hyphomicrobiales bacterium]|nr:MAG: hypothetical protein C0605_13505 [Hyphomicrobiales bacterium]
MLFLSLPTTRTFGPQLPFRCFQMNDRKAPPERSFRLYLSKPKTDALKLSFYESSLVLNDHDWQIQGLTGLQEKSQPSC